MSFLRSAFRPLANQVPSARPSSFCQVRCLSQDVRATIDKAVKANPLVLFMKGTPAVPQCGFSRAVVQLLDIHGVSGPELLKTYNVLEDQELRNAIKEYSQWPTIPQLYCKGEFVGGCDILLGMHQSGELEQFFAKEGVQPQSEEPAPTSS